MHSDLKCSIEAVVAVFVVILIFVHRFLKFSSSSSYWYSFIIFSSHRHRRHIGIRSPFFQVFVVVAVVILIFVQLFSASMSHDDVCQMIMIMGYNFTSKPSPLIMTPFSFISFSTIALLLVAVVSLLLPLLLQFFHCCKLLLQCAAWVSE